MKHDYALLMGLLTSFTISAQPTLLSSEMLGVGNTVNFRTIAHFALVDTTIQGNNSVWDFTGLSVDLAQPPFSLTIVDPASTPMGSTFPSANYAWREGPTTAYRYFHLTPDKMERVGSYTAAANIYTDPQIEYVFPFSLGTTNTDTWETAGGDGGEYHLQCIGAGILELPGITFSEVLMVRVHISASFYDLDAYIWYSAENGAILLQYIVGDGFFTSDSGMFAQGIVAGIGELDNAMGATVNNPVSAELVLNLQGQQSGTDYSILSITGALQRSGRINAGSSGERMEVSDLLPGMYLIRLHGQQGSAPDQVLRFIKE